MCRTIVKVVGHCHSLGVMHRSVAAPARVLLHVEWQRSIGFRASTHRPSRASTLPLAGRRAQVSPRLSSVQNRASGTGACSFTGPAAVEAMSFTNSCAGRARLYGSKALNLPKTFSTRAGT